MDLSSQPWFHGLINRETAEERLFTSSSSPVDGKFLVRGRSTSVSGSVSLSVVHRTKVIHYKIDLKEDGKVGIEGGPLFVDTAKLIKFYQNGKGRLAVKLTTPCFHTKEEVLEIFQNVTYDELEEATKCVLRKHGVEDETAVNEFKDLFIKIISKKLHEQQPWFHNITLIEDAEERLEKQGCADGLYLIKKSRSRPECFTLMLCHLGKCIPYQIEENHNRQLYIKGGRMFDNVMGLVSYYSKHCDGLKEKLLMSCDRTMTEFQVPKGKEKGNILLDHIIQKALTKELLNHDLTRFNKVAQDSRFELCNTPGMYLEAVDSSSDSGYEKTIKFVDKYIQPLPAVVLKKLDPNQLHLTRRLGEGKFGYVMEGLYQCINCEVKQVAVKILRKDMPMERAAFKKEASIMASLKHRNIVELIGLCEDSSMQLVMELTPLGQLKLHLQQNPEMQRDKILKLMWQVNEGMHYLESKQFVHRDLATRNVLLMSEDWAKISDFGLSRATGIGKEYYLSKNLQNDPWPIHWYAPECLQYNKFSFKGDVWSFGVTMWEALSYGSDPYKEDTSLRHGSTFINFLKHGNRLEKPIGCPVEIYNLMRKCWEFKPIDRPSFCEMKLLLNVYSEREYCKESPFT